MDTFSTENGYIGGRMSADKKKTILFFGAVIVFLAVQYIFSARYKINAGNMYLYDNNYFDGFCSAGFIGTIIRILGGWFDVDLLNYEGIYAFSKVSLIIYFIFFLIFIISVYVKAKQENKSDTALLVVIMLSLAGSMFCTTSTLGSADMYMATVLFATLSIIVIHDMPAVTIILSIIGMSIHPTYIIKCVPIITVYYAYKAIKKNERSRKYYAAAITLTCAVIFVISEIVGFGDEYSTLITPEWSHVGTNYINLIIYIFLMLPYIIMGYYFFRNVRKNVDTKGSRTTKLFTLGIIPILAGFILKSTYGMSVYFVIVYYLSFMLLTVYEDDGVYISATRTVRDSVKRKLPAAEILVIYPVLLYPMTAKAVSVLCDNIADLFV